MSNLVLYAWGGLRLSKVWNSESRAGEKKVHFEKVHSTMDLVEVHPKKVSTPGTRKSTDKEERHCSLL